MIKWFLHMIGVKEKHEVYDPSHTRLVENVPMRKLRHVEGKCQGCGVGETTWCKDDCTYLDPMDWR